MSWLSGYRRVCVNVVSDVSAILSWLSSELKCESGAARPAYIRWLSFLHTWCVLIGPIRSKQAAQTNESHHYQLPEQLKLQGLSDQQLLGLRGWLTAGRL